jgi:hypothetical protein
MLLDAGRDDLVPKLNKAILDALCNRERVVLTPGDISRRGDRIRIKANSLIGKINNHNIASTLLNIEGIGVASLEPMIKLVSGARHFDLETVPGLKEDLDNAEANLRRELSRAHARLCSEGITD